MHALAPSPAVPRHTDAVGFFARPGNPPVEWRVAEALVDYAETVDVMDARARSIAAGEAAELVWLVEHAPLYTAGTSARDGDLRAARFPVHATGRGGQYTYHGPGQRIAYAMLDLGRRREDVRAYVAALESWIIGALAKLNVKGERREDRVGVWVARPDKPFGFDGAPAEDKVAAIGVRLKRWVSTHGIAVNVDPDLSHFDGIVPCGIAAAHHGVTSLVDLGHPIAMPDFDVVLRTSFEGGLRANGRGRNFRGSRPFQAMTTSESTMSERPTRIDTTSAKGGKSGVGVRYVLIISMALVVVILAIVALVMSHTV